MPSPDQPEKVGMRAQYQHAQNGSHHVHPAAAYVVSLIPRGRLAVCQKHDDAVGVKFW